MVQPTTKTPSLLCRAPETFIRKINFSIAFFHSKKLDTSPSSIIHRYDIVNNGTWTKLSASLTTTCNNGSPCVNPNVVILDSPCPVA